MTRQRSVRNRGISVLQQLAILGFAACVLLPATAMGQDELIVEWSTEHETVAPELLSGVLVDNLGDGRYRARVEARLPARWDVFARYEVLSGYVDPLEVTIDVGGAARVSDRRSDYLLLTTLAADTDYRVDIDAVTGDPNVTFGQDRDMRTPPFDPTLSFFFDVGNDGTFEVAGGGSNFVEFEAVAGLEEIRIGGFVRGRDGASILFNQLVQLDNADPILTEARILSRDPETFEVVVAVAAEDVDGDGLTFAIDWGDGAISQGQGGIFSHTYAAEAAQYQVRITASDGRGGADSALVPLAFDQPRVNLAPNFELFDEVMRDGFEVMMAATATDPDGDSVTYVYDWGDGSPLESVAGPLATHQYAIDQFNAYLVQVTALDGRGGSDSANRVVLFENPPINRAPSLLGVHEVQRDGHRVLLALQASDPEQDRLTFEVDWGDGSPAQATASAFVEHEFPNLFQVFRVTVTVRDEAGNEDSGFIDLDFPAPAANQPPIVELVQTTDQDGFEVTLSVSAHDPDGDPLSYEFTWGDGSPPVAVLAGEARHIYPEAYQQYDVDIRVSDDRGGVVQIQHPVRFDAPEANVAPTLEFAEVISRDGFTISLAASATDANGDDIQYEIDWGDGSAPTIGQGGVGQHSYPADIYQAYQITITASDPSGLSDVLQREVEFVAPAANQAPVLDLVQVIRQAQFSVTLALAAHDDDEDPLTYVVNWGDGTTEETRAGVVTHEFPDGEYRSYSVDVLVEDGRGAFDSRRITVEFIAPADNQPPTIEHAEFVDRRGFSVVISAQGVDADGDSLTYRIDWGDGSAPVVQGSGVAAHQYPDGVYRPYTIAVTVEDGRGGSAQVDLDLEFIAPAANQDPVIRLAQVLDRDGFDVSIAVDAVDPDGDPLTYEVNWGDGSDPVASGGVAQHTYAEGVYRTYTASVLVTDGRGGEARTTFEFDFPAPPANEAPVFELAELIRQDDFSVVVAANANDPDGDDITYRFDWGDDSEPMERRGGVGEHAYAENVYRTYTVTVTALDGRGGQDTALIEVDFPAPQPNRAPVLELVEEITRDGFDVVVAASAVDADGDGLTYAFDWADGTPVTHTAGGVARHSFPDGQFRVYLVVVTVTDGRGGEASLPLVVEFVEPPPNQAPVIETVQLIRQGDWDVAATIGASDPDGDELTFTIDWGDGSPVDVSQDGVAGHSYPENQYRPYEITVQVDDGRGAVVEERREIEFPNPPPNLVPIVEELTVTIGARGLAELDVSAFDPEGEALSYRVHWGDEDDPVATEVLVGGDGTHRYELPQDGAPYQGFVIVMDESGGEVESRFVAAIVDHPTIIREVAADSIQDGVVRFSVVADDADGAEFLTYSFDFEDDGVFDVIEAARAQVVHTYERAGEHRFRVRVTDSWSGGSVSREGRLALSPWVSPNAPPVIADVAMELGPRGRLSVRVDAHDPENRPLSYFIHWGDELAADSESPLIGGQGEHSYEYDPQLNPYNGFIRVFDVDGAFALEPFATLVVDSPTSIQDIAVDTVGDGQVEVTVVAMDPDADDDLRFSYDFDGDGEWELIDIPRHQARHQFDAPGVYQTRVAVRDVWSDISLERAVRNRVEPWVPANEAPVIDSFELDVGARGRVSLSVSARDPEGQSLRRFVRWGDELEAGRDAEFAGNAASHAYAFRGPGWSYQGQLRLLDERGAETVRPFLVQLVDAPTVIRDLETERVREGTWLLRIDAVDADADDGDLSYSFDFNADGAWDVLDQASAQVVHTFEHAGDHRVRVGVRDAWSDEVEEAVYVVGPDRVGTPNLPPVVERTRITMAPGGRATLELEAYDPEGGLLTTEVAWGDQEPRVFEPLLGGEGHHVYRYALDGSAYDGLVRVTDPAGLVTLEAFTVEVEDQPTTVDQVTISVLRNGKVLASVAAQDVDSDELIYAFDMDGNGLFESGDLFVPDYLYEYRRGGTYSVVVSVTDPWSGVTTEVEEEFVLEPWISAAPVADDYLEGEEGRCLVLRLDDGRVTSEGGQSVCDRDANPGAELWRWDFGDGTVERGSEVGHIYPNDGIFSVRVTGGEASQPIESTIEVLIANVAPTFVTQPPEFATGGETYFYTVEISDQGPEDEIKLELVTGLEGMVLEPLGNRQWQLTWQVPMEAEGMFEIELKAMDGQTIDGEWRPDGGETVQRYRLNVEPTPIPDAAPPEPDAFVPNFDNVTGDQIGCAASTIDGRGSLWFICFLSVALLAARRRFRG